MIAGFFRLGPDEVTIIIDGPNLLFTETNTGFTTTVEGLKLSQSGSIKEFPDLKDNPEWKKVVIQRFKDKVKGLRTEMDRINYAKEELVKQGYEPLMYQRAGHRPVKWPKGG